VYERVQHITLKSIANNPDIVEGMTRARDRRGHQAPRRLRAALRQAVREQQQGAGDRPVHGREPVAPPVARVRRWARRDRYQARRRTGWLKTTPRVPTSRRSILDNLPRPASRTASATSASSSNPSSPMQESGLTPSAPVKHPPPPPPKPPTRPPAPQPSTPPRATVPPSTANKTAPLRR
jgi:hypothetical protein